MNASFINFDHLTPYRLAWVKISVVEEITDEERTVTGIRFYIPTEPALGTTEAACYPNARSCPLLLAPGGPQQRFAEAYRFIQETDGALHG